MNTTDPLAYLISSAVSAPGSAIGVFVYYVLVAIFVRLRYLPRWIRDTHFGKPKINPLFTKVVTDTLPHSTFNILRSLISNLEKDGLSIQDEGDGASFISPFTIYTIRNFRPADDTKKVIQDAMVDTEELPNNSVHRKVLLSLRAHDELVQDQLATKIADEIEKGNIIPVQLPTAMRYFFVVYGHDPVVLEIKPNSINVGRKYSLNNDDNIEHIMQYAPCISEQV